MHMEQGFGRMLYLQLSKESMSYWNIKTITRNKKETVFLGSIFYCISPLDKCLSFHIFWKICWQKQWASTYPRRLQLTLLGCSTLGSSETMPHFGMARLTLCLLQPALTVFLEVVPSTSDHHIKTRVMAPPKALSGKSPPATHAEHRARATPTHLNNLAHLME